jgi:CBS domain-containing protein
MATTRVGEIMTTVVTTVPAGASLAEARARVVDGRHSACPIVDGDRCVGIVTRSDLLAAPDDVAGSVGTTFGGAVVTVTAADTALTALHVMLEEQVDHLPVLDGDRLIGICTRTDILRARHRVTAAEQPEPGWLARLRAGEG